MTKIFVLHGQKVMLDRDLAALYGVETKVLKQQVKRNIERFPEDFMFEMRKEEFANWRSQFVTSNSDKMGLRYCPFCFTEQGVAMLSSILRSKKAIKVNIQIMRIFTKIREVLVDHLNMRIEIQDIKKKIQNQDKTLSWFLVIWTSLLKNRIRWNRENGLALKEIGKMISFLSGLTRL